MNNSHKIKNNQILLGIAIVVSLVLCGELAIRAYSYNLHALANSTGEYVPDFSNKFQKLRTAVEYVSLIIIYILWLIINKNKKPEINFINILKNSSFFLLIAFISYPTTTDINLYVHYGLMDLNGINPFINSASTLTSKLSSFLDWKQTSTYGPISQIFFTFSAVFVAITPSLGIYVFKLLCLLFHILNAYLIWQNLNKSPHKVNITIAYLVNPFLLYEYVINAHVDVFISTVLITLIIWLTNRNYIAAIVTAWIGFLIKTLPIIWIPLIFVYLIKQKRWKILFSAICISIGIIFAVYLIALPTVDAWRSLLNPGVEGQTFGSLYTLLQKITNLKILKFSLSFQQNIFSIFKFIMFSIFILSYLIILLKPYWKKNYSETDLSINIGWITLILFIFAAPWYCSWYSSVLLGVVALNIYSKRFVITSILFCIPTAGSGVTALPALAAILFWFVRDIQAQKKLV